MSCHACYIVGFIYGKFSISVDTSMRLAVHLNNNAIYLINFLEHDSHGHLSLLLTCITTKANTN